MQSEAFGVLGVCWFVKVEALVRIEVNGSWVGLGFEVVGVLQRMRSSYSTELKSVVFFLLLLSLCVYLRLFGEKWLLCFFYFLFCGFRNNGELWNAILGL